MNDVRQLRRHLSRIVDGLSMPDDERAIAELLQQNKNLCDEYVDFALSEAAIYHACRSAMPAAQSATANTSASETTASRWFPGFAHDWLRNIRTPTVLRNHLISVALAASLVAILASVAFLRWSPPGHFLAIDDAAWGQSQHFDIGDALNRDWIHLDAGSVTVRLHRSTMLRLDGPAVFRLQGGNACELRRGSVVAFVPPSAKGFTLETPTSTVVDLGTSFRVDVDENGESKVQVLEGQVRVTASHDGASQDYFAGAALISPLGQPMHTATAEQIEPKTSNRVAFRTKHVPSLGRDGLKRNDRCFLFLERFDFELPHDLEVNVAGPGTHGRFTNDGPTIPNGARVHSYLVHCAPINGRNLVEGVITFDQEILGIIASSDKLNASNSLFSSPWSLHCQDQERGLETAPNFNADRIEISPDRRTIRLQLRTQSIDQMRILVRATP